MTEPQDTTTDSIENQRKLVEILNAGIEIALHIARPDDPLKRYKCLIALDPNHISVFVGVRAIGVSLNNQGIPIITVEEYLKPGYLYHSEQDRTP